MGTLDDLAMGLRGAGAIMSPDVYKAQGREQEIAQQLQEERKRLMMQQVIKAAESGAIPPQVAQQQLAQMGMPNMPVGPDAHTQQRQEEIQRRDAISKALGSLTPEDRQDPLKIANVFLTNGDHAAGAKYVDLAEQRQARQQTLLTSLAQRQAELDQRSEDRRLDREQRAALAAQSNALREQIAQGQQALQRDSLELRRVIAQNRPQAQPQILQTSEGTFAIDRPGATARPVLGPDGRPLAGKSTEKALPTSAAQKLFENQQNLRRAEQAEALIKGEKVGDIQGDPNATGAKGYLPDALLQRTDKSGVDTRAAIGDLGSLIIHDRSGAAVTAAEFPRLRPFIPQVTDDPATVKKKLGRFVTEYRKQVKETQDFYKESGYKVPDVLQPSGVGATGGWSVKEK